MHVCAAEVTLAGTPGGDSAELRTLADGSNLSTLALSERGSRSHFWAPVSRLAGTRLSAQKSFVTSAGHADSYVVSTRPAGPTRRSSRASTWCAARRRASRRPGRVERARPARQRECPDDLRGDRRRFDAARRSRQGSRPDARRRASLVPARAGRRLARRCRGRALRRRRARHRARSSSTSVSRSRTCLRSGRVSGGRQRRSTRSPGSWRTWPAGWARATRQVPILSAKASANEMAIRVTSEAMQACGGAAMSTALPDRTLVPRCPRRLGDGADDRRPVRAHRPCARRHAPALGGAMTMGSLLVGAVAYDAKVVPIWEGIREYFSGSPGRDGRDLVLELRGAGRRAPRRLDRRRVEHQPRLRAGPPTRPRAPAGSSRCATRTSGSARCSSGEPGELAEPDGPQRQDPRARQRRLGAGRDHARALPHAARGSRPAGMSDSCGSTPTSASMVTPGGASGRRSGPCSIGEADAAAVGAASWDVLVRGGEVPPGRLAPFWTSPPYNHCNFTALAVARCRTRRRVDRAPDGDGLGEARAPADPRARGPARVGPARSSRATATCSRPSTSRGSPRDGDARPERGAGRQVRRRGPRPRVGPDLRARRAACPTSRSARCWSSRARTRRSRTSSRRGVAAPATSSSRPSPTADRTLYRIRRGSARIADVQGPTGLGRLARVPSRRVRHAGLARRKGCRDPRPRRPDHRLLAAGGGGRARRSGVPLHRDRARPALGAQRRVALRAGDGGRNGTRRPTSAGGTCGRCRPTSSARSARS